MIVPAKEVVVPNVAELPTCQNTFDAFAPLISFTLLADAVISVEPIWNVKTAFGSPRASKVTVPVIPSELAEL
ncbi:MAG: hypothetical protein JWP70_1657 [Leifsonia sp.]|nr:hypothetical protein [Leifsonia sp.]